MIVHKTYYFENELENISELDHTTFFGAMAEYLSGLPEMDCLDFVANTATVSNSTNYCLHIAHKKRKPRITEDESYPISRDGTEGKLSIRIVVSGSNTTCYLRQLGSVETTSVTTISSSNGYKKLALTYTRNDYDECMLTFFFSSDSDKNCMTSAFMECVGGDFEGLSVTTKGSNLYYSFGQSSGYYTQPLKLITAVGDENKYLIPAVTPYNIFKRGYIAVNRIQGTNDPYVIGKNKFVECAYNGYQGFAMLYEEG